MRHLPATCCHLSRATGHGGFQGRGRASGAECAGVHGQVEGLGAALEPRGQRCALPSGHSSNKPKSISPWAGGRASAADAAGAPRGAERGNGNQMGPAHSWHLRSRAERALVAGSFPGVLVQAGSAGPTVPGPWVTLTRTLGVRPPGGPCSAPLGGSGLRLPSDRWCADCPASHLRWVHSLKEADLRQPGGSPSRPRLVSQASPRPHCWPGPIALPSPARGAPPKQAMGCVGQWAGDTAHTSRDQGQGSDPVTNPGAGGKDGPSSPAQAVPASRRRRKIPPAPWFPPRQQCWPACTPPLRTPARSPARSPLLTAPQSRPHGFRRVHRSDPRARAPGRGRGRSSPPTGRKPAPCALPAPAGLACGAEGQLLWRWGTQPRAWIPGQDGQRAWDPWGACHHGRGGGGTSWMAGDPGGGAPGSPRGWGVQGGGVSWDGGCPGGGASWG